jgi:hypothetical protein
MSTKRTVFWISIIGGLTPLLVWLGEKTGSGVFTVLAIVLSFVTIGLLLYAGFREKAHAEKSERISPRAAVTILGLVGLWVVFVFYRALSH